MGKQIKYIWLLTILTVLMVIGGQIYWLFGQYRYISLEYIARMNDTLLAIQRLDVGRQASAGLGEKECTDSLEYLQTKYSLQMNWDKQSPAAESVLRFYRCNENGIISAIDSFNVAGLPLSVVMDAALRYSKYMKQDFNVLQFDSLLRQHRLVASDLSLAKLDSALWGGIGFPERSFLRYRMKFVYPYNPFVRQAVVGYLEIPVNPLLKSMGWQLAASLVLLVLLVYCLAYQVRMILRQYKLEELRTGFVHTMIHELKRPVQTLKMCVAFLNNRKMRNDNQMMDEVVKDAMFELDNLSAYLAKIREMTRATDEHTTLAVRTFDIGETIRQIIRLAVVPSEKHVRFEMSVHPDPLMVKADPVHLTNCISNLIENAVKYSGAEVCVEVKASLENNRLFVEVKDNGFGLSSQDCQRIFDKFYRSEQAVSRNLPGIGLGLSYVKLMVEAHGGSIRVESEQGKGSAFILDIPQ